MRNNNYKSQENCKMEDAETIDVTDYKNQKVPTMTTSFCMSIAMSGDKEEEPLITPDNCRFFRHRHLSDSSESDISVTALSPTPSRVDYPDSVFDSQNNSPVTSESTNDTYCTSECSEVSDSSSFTSGNTSQYFSENNNIEKMYHISDDYLERQKHHLLEYQNLYQHNGMNSDKQYHNQMDINLEVSSFHIQDACKEFRRSELNKNHKPVTEDTPAILELNKSSKGSSTSNNTSLHQCRWLQCNNKFVLLDDLVNHVNDAHIRAERDIDFKCYWENCPRHGKGFNARYKMLIHVRTHTNEKPYKCDICHKSFSRLENLKIHNRSHTGERPYVCPFDGCNKAYSNSSDRFKHVRTHQEQKPYSCRMPGCDKRYTDPSSLRKHIKTHGHYFRKLSKFSEAKQRKYDTIEKFKENKIKLCDKTTKVEKPNAAILECSALMTKDINKCSDYAEPQSKITDILPHVSSQSPIALPSSNPQVPLPTYLPPLTLPSISSKLTERTPLLYPSKELYPYKHMTPAQYQNISRDNSLSKQMLPNSVSLFSHLSSLQPTYIGTPPPSITFPLGSTLLTVSPSAISNTIPNDKIAFREKMVDISDVKSDLDKKTLSAYYSYIYSPSSLCTSHYRADGPLDLSNPTNLRKLPTYVTTAVYKDDYRPIYTHVQN